MTEFYLVIGVTLCLAWVTQRTYVNYPNSPQTTARNRLCWIAIFLTLALFIGLRKYYNDTSVYISIYRQSQTIPEVFSSFSKKLGDNPGFVLLNSLLKTFDISHHGFLLFYSGFSVAVFLYFIKRYSNNVLLSLFLFFSTNTYLISAAAVKQSMAIAIALFGIKFAIDRKWLYYFIVLFLAATFHPYVLVFALVPFLLFKPWSRGTYILIAGTLIAGFMLEALLGTIIDMTSMIGDSYSEEDLIGDGINVFRVLVSNAPLLLTFVYRNYIFNDSTRANHLMINLSMLNGAVMFVGMFGTAIYFSRLASYFTVSQCIALPWILSKLPHKHRRFFMFFMIVGYVGFFLYANVLVNSFGNSFDRITVWEYVSQLIS